MGEPCHPRGHSTAPPRGAAPPSFAVWPKAQSHPEPRSLLELERCVNLNSDWHRAICFIAGKYVTNFVFCIGKKKILVLLVLTFDFSSFSFYFSLSQPLKE